LGTPFLLRNDDIRSEQWRLLNEIMQLQLTNFYQNWPSFVEDMTKKHSGLLFS